MVNHVSSSTPDLQRRQERAWGTRIQGPYEEEAQEFLVVIESRAHQYPLHCQPQDSRRLLDRQLTLHEEALKADPSFCCMPPRFIEENRVNWFPKAVAQPFYRDQLTAHAAELEHQITNLSQRIEIWNSASTETDYQ